MAEPITCIHGMYGLGDNIYQRAFVRQFPGAWLRTPWPEIYAGLDIQFVRSATRLRTQQKNEALSEAHFVREPVRPERTINVFYGPEQLARGSIMDAMSQQFGRTAAVFDLPCYGASPVRAHKPLAVIRPATVRREWANPARNPDPVYLAEAAQLLRAHFYVVSLADLEQGEEWLVGEPPIADLVLHRGELRLTQLLALIEHAAVVVTGVGWALPAALAYRTPVFTVQGGCGAHNAPHIVTSPLMDLRRAGWAQPDNYCLCNRMDHHCDKQIRHFSQRFNGWLYENVLATPAK